MDKQNQNNKKRAIIIFLLIAAIIALFLILVDVESVISQLLDADLWYIALASAVLIISMAAYAIRWRALLGNQPPFLLTFHAANLGHAANILIPFRAGEVIRILVMGRSTLVSYTETTTSVVVERLFEQLMRLLTLILAIFIGVGLQPSPAAIIGGVAFVVLGFAAIAWLVNHQEFTLQKGSALLSKIPRISSEDAHRSLSDLLQNLKVVSKPRQFSLILLYSILTWALFLGFFYLTLRALNLELPLQEQLAISLGALALSPPSAPTQPGLFHASVVLPLSALDFNPEMLTAYAILLHIQGMLWMVGFGIWALIATGLSFGTIRDNI